MTERVRNRGAKTLSISVIVGTLLVPLSAAAAFWLVDPGSDDDSAATANETTTTTFMTSPESTYATTVALSQDGLKRGDLEEACGPAGMELVALEEDESITDVQQAALDALRDICEQEEMPLPERAQPEPIVQTVVVTERASSPPTTTPEVAEDQSDEEYHDGYEDYEDEDEDEEDEEDEHEEDEDDEHEHEDHEED